MPMDRRVQRAMHQFERLERRAENDARKRARKQPLSVERIVDTALGIVAAEGFEALTMRRVAAALDTGPASLYAHVVNKADLDELLIGYLCSQLVMPKPNAKRWRQQLLDVAVQIRDQYLKYPGISRAALGVVPSNRETLRISEEMLGIMLAGGVSPQAAAWGIDSLSLYINAYCLEMSMWIDQMNHQEGGWVLTHDALMKRFAALDDREFPLTKQYAAQLTAGEGHDRFDFAVRTMIDGFGGR